MKITLFTLLGTQSEVSNPVRKYNNSNNENRVYWCEFETDNLPRFTFVKDLHGINNTLASLSTDVLNPQKQMRCILMNSDRSVYFGGGFTAFAPRKSSILFNYSAGKFDASMADIGLLNKKVSMVVWNSSSIPFGAKNIRIFNASQQGTIINFTLNFGNYGLGACRMLTPVTEIDFILDDLAAIPSTSGQLIATYDVVI